MRNVAQRSLQEFWFGRVNSRPLSLFRICFALILLKDALFHLPLAEVFYSDIGAAPRAAIQDLTRHLVGRFTVMDALPTTWMATLFFIVWVGVALCLLVGFRTRLMAVLNFVIVLSVYERNPFVVNGADDIVRVLSFWMIFIPLNHHYSIDADLVSRTDSQSDLLFGDSAYAFPVRLMQIQIALIYLTTGIFKLLGSQWVDGTALSYVLQLNSWLQPLGQWLAANGPDWLLRLLTYLVIVVEMAFPILVFIPFGQPRLRIVGLLSVGLLHLGIAMTTPLLDFLMVLTVSYLLFFSQSIGTEQSPDSAPGVVTAESRDRILRPAVNVVLGLLMVFVLWKNADNFRWHNAPIVPAMPPAAAAVVNLTGLRQAWNLFSPTPVQVDWSIAIPGTFENNATYDLRTGAPIRTDIEPVLLGPDYRWKQYQMIVGQDRPIPLLDAWSSYYCRKFNAGEALQRQSRLDSLEIRLMYRRSHAPGQMPNPVQSDLLWIQTCER
jgi:hypothetical protein